MPDKCTTTPIVGSSEWYVTDFDLHFHRELVEGAVVVIPARCSVWIKVIGDTGDTREHRYGGQEAHDDIVGLNKANLTTQTLQKRLLAKLVTLEVLSGTVGGTPE
jgi:hypothetical protein